MYQSETCNLFLFYMQYLYNVALKVAICRQSEKTVFQFIWATKDGPIFQAIVATMPSYYLLSSYNLLLWVMRAHIKFKLKFQPILQTDTKQTKLVIVRHILVCWTSHATDTSTSNFLYHESTNEINQIESTIHNYLKSFSF